MDGQWFFVCPASPPPSRHCRVSYGTQAGCTANLDVGQQTRGSRHSLPRPLVDAVGRGGDARDLPPHWPAFGDWLLPARGTHIAAHHVEIEMEANRRQRTGDRRDEKLKPAATFQRTLNARYDVAASPSRAVDFTRGSREERDKPSRLGPSRRKLDATIANCSCLRIRV